MHDDLQKKFDSLPEDLKEAITSVDFAESLQTIGKNRELHLDQLDQLFEQVGLVLLGEIHPDQFGPRVAKMFGLSESGKNMLVRDVDEKIFKPIHTSLMSLYEKPAEVPIIPQKPAEINPPAPVIPHESDYSMSRDDILSAIENPQVAKLENEYVPRKAFETNDPHAYLEKRVEMLKKIESQLMKIETPSAKKKSLSEEAVLVAKAKVGRNDDRRFTRQNFAKQNLGGQATDDEKKIPPEPLPPITAPQQLPKPADKLEKMVQIPRQIVNVVSPISANKTGQSGTSSSSDPYRELV